MAQVVPDICPREKEFVSLMKDLRRDLVKIVHGDQEKYTSVLFCGSGTINIDVCLNSLLPENKKVLIVNNGAYSRRAVEICRYYGLPHRPAVSGGSAFGSETGGENPGRKRGYRAGTYHPQRDGYRHTEPRQGDRRTGASISIRDGNQAAAAYGKDSQASDTGKRVPHD